MTTGESLKNRDQFVYCIRECGGDIEPLQTTFSEATGTEQDKKSILEQSFRDALHEAICRCPPSVSDVSPLTDLILLAIQAAQAGICYYPVPFILSSDLLDCVTLDVCETVFVFLENQVSTWTQPGFYVAGKNLLLRMCNDLLRRLSSAQNTVFCGRIQLFLARFFPLSEKSALNLMSHFDFENVTTYNKTAGVVNEEETPGTEKDGGKQKRKKKVVQKEREEGEEGEEDMEIEETFSDGLEEVGAPIDYNLYHKLWAIQDSFRSPAQCYSPEHWRVLTTNVGDILKAFGSYKLEAGLQPSSKSSRKRGQRERKAAGDKLAKSVDLGESESHYFAKFLTSEKLMNLQLRDSHFRRHILIQFLVLFQYLTGSIKFKPASHVATETQQAWIQETSEKVYQLIAETPPNGAEFSTYIRQVLKREENWIAWKNEGCPSFEKAPLTTSDLEPRPKRPHLGDGHAIPSRKLDLGSAELSRLWNLCPDNLAACRTKHRVFVPDAEQFLAEAAEQADPVARIEAEYKVISNPNFAWRSLRLLSQASPHFFQNTTAAIRSLPDYLEHVVVKTVEELKSSGTS